MAAQEETTQQRAVFVDTSNEPRTDEEAVSMCTQGLERATAPQDIADLQFRLANAQVRRGFPELAVTAFRACIEADPRCVDAFNNLGLLLMRRYDYAAAAADTRGCPRGASAAARPASPDRRCPSCSTRADLILTPSANALR